MMISKTWRAAESRRELTEFFRTYREIRKSAPKLGVEIEQCLWSEWMNKGQRFEPRSEQ